MRDATCLAVVLAAGEGTRMRSARPKVLHEIAGRSMLGHVLASARAAGADAITVVVGPQGAPVAAGARKAAPDATTVVQHDRRGTAHAVLSAREALAMARGDVLVLYGDVPLVRPETLIALREALADGAAVAVLAFQATDPTGYGRMLMDGEELVAIREHKDATPAERAVKLCNAGIMALAGAHALVLLDTIRADNAQGEFYLTDIVEAGRRVGLRAVVRVADAGETMGVNDRVQLAQAEAAFQDRLRETAMRGGATLIAPDTVFLAHDTVLGRDVIVEPHVVFGPGVAVEEGAVIHAFSHLEGAHVGPGASVGPYARLRPGARLERKAKAGNFVEIKNATLGEDAKVSHLTYIGDAEVGARTNVGAGTVTCNYDGFSKFRTIIGADAFIGSNSSLVAPVSVGRGAFVGSGSVVTRDVAPDALALARGQQVEKPGWATAFRARQTPRGGT